LNFSKVRACPETLPLPDSQRHADDPDTQRICVNVADQLLHVPLILRDHGLVPVLEQIPGTIVSLGETLRVACVQRTHVCGEVDIA